MSEVNYSQNQMNSRMMNMSHQVNNINLETDLATALILHDYVNSIHQTLAELENNLTIDLAQLNKPGSIY